MQKIDICKEWKFKRSAPSVMSVMVPGGEMVNLPHDAEISTDVNKNSPNGNSTGWYDGTFASYDKNYFFPEEWRGKKIYLLLDGAFWCTEVSLNGNLMGFHPSGYAPYCCDLTDRINFGENNRINLFVNNSQQRTGRWYSGTGVYRKVYLLVGEPVHLSQYPAFVTLKNYRGDATAAVTVINASGEDREITVKVSLLYGQKMAGEGSVKITVPRKKSVEAQINLKVSDLILWDTENPFLYTVDCGIYEGQTLLDKSQSKCGLRIIEISHDEGLKLNGKPLKLKGGCVHSDNGILGAVSLYDVEYRKIKLHKAAGYNAFRSSHNPPSDEFLRACDELGMLVLDELFDVWRMLKDPNDYHLFFNEWWKRDAYSTVMRDRAHPCVFAYSIGNEIGERNGLNGGYELCREVADYVRTVDNTRPLNVAIPTTFNGLDDKDTAAMLQSLYVKMQGGEKIQNLTTEYSEKIFNDKTAKFAEPVDIVGYNYIENRYEGDIQTFPERIFIQTESYPRTLGHVWELVQKHPCILGDFVWTSMDYLGEAALGIAVYSDPEEKKAYSRLNPPPTGYPWRSANCGDFDLTGERRNQIQYRQCVWGSSETFLEVVHPDKYGKDVYLSPYGWEDAYNCWSFSGYDGKPAKANVYSAAEEVELIVNGISLGRKPCGRAHDFTAVFDVVYNAGEITAISYNGGKEVSRKGYKTCGEPAKLVLESDKTQLKADGQSLAFVRIYVADNQGNRLYLNDYKCTAKAEGAAALMAFGSANPCTEENYCKGEFTTCKGAILAVIRSGYSEGEAKITVACPLGEFSISLEVK